MLSRVLIATAVPGSLLSGDLSQAPFECPQVLNFTINHQTLVSPKLTQILLKSLTEF